MKNGIAIGLGLALGLSIATFVLAQDPPAAPGAGKAGKGKGRGPATPTGPTPHLADGTVDLSGVWMGSGSNSGDITKGLKPGEQVIMLPAADAHALLHAV
jgi:hypothetical protein